MEANGDLMKEPRQKLADPLNVQKFQKALSLDPLLTYVGGILNETHASDSSSDEEEYETLNRGDKVINGVVVSKSERKNDKHRLFNLQKVKKNRKWLKNILVSDSSDDDEDESKEVSEEEIQHMLQLHKYHGRCRAQFYKDSDMRQYQYYSVGLLSNFDKFLVHQRSVVGTKRIKEKKNKTKSKNKKQKVTADEAAVCADEFSGQGENKMVKGQKVKHLTQEQIANRRKKLWLLLCKKELQKAQKQKASARKELLLQLKKVAKECQKECRRATINAQKGLKEASSRAKRLSREMLLYWKRFDKVEKEHRKRVEKEAIEQRKIDLELREAKRQQRKLNFLITQTELYAHFMSRKVHGEADASTDSILRQLEDEPLPGNADDEYDVKEVKAKAMFNVEKAYEIDQKRTSTYDVRIPCNGTPVLEEHSSLANPTISTKEDRPQPLIFNGKLKGYQLKGMNWLANLYDQGINGILADEMGLGKTVQSVALLAHLAESQGIWGPFLIIAPASTLHNWQQECARFVSKLKVVPYWGNTQDRRILRTFWNQEHLNTKEASFHVVITSYQLVVQDVKYFQRIKWQYMILDEAQAIKSTQSIRWKMLLGFNCRNRLLLTGTPIQNSMAELWALLHFIMPTLFDSHEEFNEWFSKDIESHAEKQSGIDENQLSRLHMILKPFMLRRVKKDVENELSDKIEILVYCPLTRRQKLLYEGVKQKISIEDLLQSASSSTALAQSCTSSLMNLVMQFRKVCNHPELFERREVKGPFFTSLPSFILPKLVFRDGLVDTAIPSKQHLIYQKFYIYHPFNIHESILTSKSDSCFSFTRFTNMSPTDLHNLMLTGILARWLAIFTWFKDSYNIYHKNEWHDKGKITDVKKNDFLLEPTLVTSFANITSSCNLQKLVFVHPDSSVYSHTRHLHHFMDESAAHRKIRLRKTSGKKGSPTKSRPSESFIQSSHRHIVRSPEIFEFEATEIPPLLYYTVPKTVGLPLEWYSCDRSWKWEEMKRQLGGTLEAKNSLLCGTQSHADELRCSMYYFRSQSPGGLRGVQPRYGYSGIYVPDKETLVTDAGKLYVLDTLLGRLKAEGHRVLIYSQMTRMIDILEEYMWHRKHTYMRLDGSSKISDRRDMVADFQARSDIFVFLLSTRAGGLGINLTAADTVIFYDSDWNPTVDQQAMDRAHRLGQTKQVTVYRLICKGSIEERILQRAKEKSEIQRMVISGGSFKPDTLKPKEVVSLLLDDDEMEKKLLAKQEERNHKDDDKEERKRKREFVRLPGRRGPGRPPKKKKLDGEANKTIAAADADAISMDSVSATASPQSVKSGCSEATFASLNLSIQDDSSNDALVIVDEASQPSTPVTGPSTVTPIKRGRGRPKGSGTIRKLKAGIAHPKGMSSAEVAGAQAAYATYGYTLSDTSSGNPANVPPKSANDSSSIKQ